MFNKNRYYPTPASAWKGFLYSFAFGLFVPLFFNYTMVHSFITLNSNSFIYACIPVVCMPVMDDKPKYCFVDDEKQIIQTFNNSISLVQNKGTIK